MVLLAAFAEGQWHILEPIMNVEVAVPAEFVGAIIADLTKRNALIKGTDSRDDYATILCEVSNLYLK